MKYNKIFNSLKELLKDPIYNIPKRQMSANSFPMFIKESIEDYITFYKEKVRNTVNDLPTSEGLKEPKVLSNIERLSNGINDALASYYEGKILSATNHFNEALKDVFYKDIKSVITLNRGSNFYRARITSSRSYVRHDMFHVPFELRNIVATNRYSIPGLPALYVGDSTFVCWEEFNRYKFRDLNFCRLSNVEDLNVISIQRSEDLISTLSLDNSLTDLVQMLSYIASFPLTMACSVLVANQQAIFKPEYIIPQLLLQFIKDDPKLDGIKYSSTKVDYTKLINVPAYNYIFPVKKSMPKGFCPKLSSIFQLTDPSSLEIEELIENPIQQSGFILQGKQKDINSQPRQLKFYEDSIRGYDFTSFGYIEEKLKERPLKNL